MILVSFLIVHPLLGWLSTGKEAPWIIETSVTLTTPVDLPGVVLTGTGHLTLSHVPAPGVRLFGDVVLLGDSQLTIEHSVVEVMSQYHGQLRLLAAQQSQVVMEDVWYQVQHQFQHTIVATDQARIEITNSAFPFVQWSAEGQAQWNASSCNGVFECLVSGQGEMSLTGIPAEAGSGVLWAWVEIPPGARLELSVPRPGLIEDWQFPPEEATGIHSQVRLSQCEVLFWPMMIWNDTNLILKEIAEEAHVIGGLLFPNSAQVSDLHPKSAETWQQLSLKDRTLILDRAAVDTWNLYALKEARLTVERCTLGEVLAFHQSRVNLWETFVDGSGGYVGARDEAVFQAVGSVFSCDVQASQKALMHLSQCLLTPQPGIEETQVRIFDEASLHLVQCQVEVPQVLGTHGSVGMYSLDPMPQEVPSEPLLLRGTFVFPDSVCQEAEPSWQLVAVEEWLELGKRSNVRDPVLWNITVIGNGVGRWEDREVGIWHPRHPERPHRLRLMMTCGDHWQTFASWPVGIRQTVSP